jgi:prepilin-type N-terminal cleavage/methylation domain-containing protein/prepilin-type processing-associated H-X9-DG protein
MHIHATTRPDAGFGLSRDPRATARAAFTLVELLVVIVVIVVLGAILSVVGRNAMASADHAKCLSNVKQLVAATILASTDLNGRFPDMEKSGGPWMQDVLWPYLNGDSPKPSKVPVVNTVYTCNAAQKNSQRKWMKNGVHYRYNSFTAPGKTPLYDWGKAVLIFDKHWGDWPANACSHFPGIKAKVNIGYADGHVAAMSYQDSQKVWGWGGSVEGYCPIFQKGWNE